MQATTIAFVMTWFKVFDVPVFWPILLVYFIVLFVLTMKRQIRHMIKHRYLPFDLGKKKFKVRIYFCVCACVCLRACV